MSEAGKVACGQIVAALAFGAFMYFLCALTAWDFNPARWDGFGRFFLGAAMFPAMIAGAVFAGSRGEALPNGGSHE